MLGGSRVRGEGMETGRGECGGRTGQTYVQTKTIKYGYYSVDMEEYHLPPDEYSNQKTKLVEGEKNNSSGLS